MQGMLEKNGRILRPLLPFSSMELKQLSKKMNVSWREDSSNQSTKYLRNLFRLNLIPVLEQEIPTLRDSIQHMQGVFQSTLQENQAEIEAITERILKNKTITSDEVVHITDFKLVEVLKSLSIPAVFAKKILELLHTEAGKQLIWKPNEGPFQSIVKERDSFRFLPTNPQAAIRPTFHAQLITELPSVFDKKTLFLDQSMVVGELYVRPWTKGDRMQPIGLSGSKLISDILKDDHVPTTEKHERFVLCDDEKIICCIGHRIDRRSIASEQSKLIIRVEIQQ
jgi:tRNA(Ile)-lysidine synthase